EAAPGPDAAADVGADVEADVAGPEELRVEATHLPLPPGNAVVHGQRAPDAPGAAEHVSAVGERRHRGVPAGPKAVRNRSRNSFIGQTGAPGPGRRPS